MAQLPAEIYPPCHHDTIGNTTMCMVCGNWWQGDGPEPTPPCGRAKITHDPLARAESRRRQMEFAKRRASMGFYLMCALIGTIVFSVGMIFITGVLMLVTTFLVGAPTSLIP